LELDPELPELGLGDFQLFLDLDQDLISGERDELGSGLAGGGSPCSVVGGAASWALVPVGLILGPGPGPPFRRARLAMTSSAGCVAFSAAGAGALVPVRSIFSFVLGRRACVPGD
jgi:hypothetical protein